MIEEAFVYLAFVSASTFISFLLALSHLDYDCQYLMRMKHLAVCLFVFQLDGNAIFFVYELEESFTVRIISFILYSFTKHH